MGGSGDEGLARIDTVVAFAPNGTVELSLVSGSMKISSWDRNQVRVVATTTGEPTLQFDASSSHLSLEQSGRHNSRNGVGNATYEVTVPTGSRASLSAVSGDIYASGIRGPVDASVVSGRVDARDMGSSLSIEGVSGNMTVSHVANDVRISNVSGRVTLAGVGGTLDVETVSGGIAVSGVAGDRVHVTTVSGNIDFTGNPARSGRYEFETHSGQTDLHLPSNANAVISVETFSGSVTNDHPGAVRRRNSDAGDDRTNYDYVVGRGEGAGRLHVDTFSGSVHIFQGNP
ncbi:MAG: DUF4097 domain-containing protein [Gemmatimonadota bacterium]|nr:DUF4097 domain-containing protein [Gemmatimonadota bacterium]